MIGQSRIASYSVALYSAIKMVPTKLFQFRSVLLNCPANLNSGTISLASCFLLAILPRAYNDSTYKRYNGAIFPCKRPSCPGDDQRLEVAGT